MACFYRLPAFHSNLHNHFSNQSENISHPRYINKFYLFINDTKSASRNFDIRHRPKNGPIIFPLPNNCRGDFLVRANGADIDDKVPLAYLSQAPRDSGILSYIPEGARPYARLMRLDKSSAVPAQIASPSIWAIALTTEPGTIVDVKTMLFFHIVLFLTRAIVITINDYLDKDIDAKVERTKQRPLPSGEVKPFQALCLLGFLMLSCYGLLLRVNNLSRKLWLLSQVLIFTYPLMKRLTYWPQAYLGLTINSLPLSCWAAVKGSLDAHILVPLCVSGFLWTLVYETIYSHQDKQDDAKIGVKSPALLLGDSTKIWVTGFAVACIVGLLITGLSSSIGWPYYVFVAAASCHFAWQICSVDLNSPADCYEKFDTNRHFGTIILSGILLGRLIK